MSVKFLTFNMGGTLANAIKAIDYTTKMKVDITNNSWGDGEFSQALYDAIKRARDAGILFVAAAGNSSSNNDIDPSYPASYDLDNIISVAAVDNAGALAFFSSYGKTTVDIAAPGVNIVSTTPKGFDSFSGTSMAAPHVAGVAALLKSANPQMTYLDIKNRILKSSRPLASLRGKIATGGMVNAYHALMNTVPPNDVNDPFLWSKSIDQIATPHPYKNNSNQSWTLHIPGAKRMAAYFSRFETEIGYDKITFKNGAGIPVAVWSGNHNDSFSPIIDGDTMTITFTTDDSGSASYGFDLQGVAYK